MSLRIVPQKGHASSTTQGLFTGAPSAPGVHDTLRTNLNLAAPAPSANPSTAASAPTSSSHPLEARLANWRATQDALKMNLLGRQFGIAEPVRRGMELAIVREGEWTPEALIVGGRQNVAGDILEGRDGEVAWEDVYHGEMGEGMDLHTEIEMRGRMNW